MHQCAEKLARLQAIHEPAEGFRSRRRYRHPGPRIFSEKNAEMPTRPAREPTKPQLLLQCVRYIAGIVVLLVAVALVELRLVWASHAVARLGERIGGGPPIFS